MEFINGRYILKPLESGYKYVELGVTTAERLLYPPEFILDDKEKLMRAASMGHAFGSIVQHSQMGTSISNLTNNLHLVDDGQTLGSQVAKQINDMYLRQLASFQNGNKKEQNFYKNLQEGNFLKIGTRYNNIYRSEVPLYLYVECGKYLVCIKSGGYDSGGIIGNKHILYDQKYYSKYLKGNDGNLGTIYKNTDKDMEILTKPFDESTIITCEQAQETDLGKKIQRWMYPLMAIDDDCFFQYNLAVKSESLSRNICPNMQEVRIDVSMDRAKERLKKTLVDLFTNNWDDKNNCFIENT